MSSCSEEACCARCLSRRPGKGRQAWDASAGCDSPRLKFESERSRGELGRLKPRAKARIFPQCAKSRPKYLVPQTDIQRQAQGLDDFGGWDLTAHASPGFGFLTGMDCPKGRMRHDVFQGNLKPRTSNPHTSPVRSHVLHGSTISHRTICSQPWLSAQPGSPKPSPKPPKCQSRLEWLAALAWQREKPLSESAAQASALSPRSAETVNSSASLPR